MANKATRSRGVTLTEEDKARIVAAETAIDGMAAEFTASLQGRVNEIARALAAGDRAGAENACYNLKSSAGNFGWGMIGVAADYMLNAMSDAGDDSALASNDVVRVHLNALRTLSQPSMQGETPEGKILLEGLYILLDRRGLLPDVLSGV